MANGTMKYIHGLNTNFGNLFPYEALAPAPRAAPPTARERERAQALPRDSAMRYRGATGAGPWPSTYWCYVPVI